MTHNHHPADAVNMASPEEDMDVHIESFLEGLIFKSRWILAVFISCCSWCYSASQPDS